MAPHQLTKDEEQTMFHLHICRDSGERIGKCQCATCRLSRGESVDLQTRQQAARRGGAE